MNTEKSYYLKPGYIFFSEEPYIVDTVLGSCISVCIWDSVRMTGGINHFIHPRGIKEHEKNGRYGNYSCHYLIKLFLDSGSKKINLRARIVGGADNIHISKSVGHENIVIAHEILNEYGILIQSEETGGHTGRRISFKNKTGEISIRPVKNIEFESRNKL